MGGGGDRDRLGARVEPGLGAATRRRWGSGRGRARAGRGVTPPAPSASIRSRIAAVTASRGASSSVKRRPEASSRVAPSPRTASVISRPSKRVPGRASAVGWNWQNSRSARSAPAAAASTGPAPIAPRGLVVRRHSAAAPPVASTVAAAAIGPSSVSSPWQRSPSLHSAIAEVLSRTSIRGSAATIAASFEVISWPVWLPPEWTMRRRVWPPSRPSASSPSGVEVEDDPARAQLAHRGRRLLDQRPAPPRGGRGPRPAAIVSAACWAGESPGSSAAASPPWAQKLALWESGVRETTQTAAPCSAARSAVQSPAAPPPTTATSHSALRLSLPPPLGGSPRSDRAARRRPLRGRGPRSSAIVPSAAAARRSASSTRFSAASACASISARRPSAAAIARSLASRSRCSSSACARRSASSASEARAAAPSPGPLRAP